MIQIYDVETAQNSILRRGSAGAVSYPRAVTESVERIFGERVSPLQAVAIIIESVRKEGDTAIRKWSQVLDNVIPEDVKVPEDDLRWAFGEIPDDLRNALTKAVRRIREFHEHQPLPNWQTDVRGGTLGQRTSPISCVGFYVPGGTAPLPSSWLRSVIPAQVAGVGKLIVCTPPRPDPSILAAAQLGGPLDIYQIGGAQAIAAMAYGTETVPKVDKIVGAGNLFVTLAKQQVYGEVGLDGLAGPTETMVIADGTARPAWVAADLLAQAEHDVLASAILLTPDKNLAKAVQHEIARQLEGLSRADIIVQSLAEQGGIVITPDLDTAVKLANDYAAEHLCLAVAEPKALAERITNAGGIFIGERSFEVLGDYVAGPSHIMPTGGSARFSSPLNVFDFVKITSIVALDARTSSSLSSAASRIAKAETLTAHVAAAELRMEDGCV